MTALLAALLVTSAGLAGIGAAAAAPLQSGGASTTTGPHTDTTASNSTVANDSQSPTAPANERGPLSTIAALLGFDTPADSGTESNDGSPVDGLNETSTDDPNEIESPDDSDDTQADSDDS